jgi:hypothetical protein
MVEDPNEISIEMNRLNSKSRINQATEQEIRTTHKAEVVSKRSHIRLGNKILPIYPPNHLIFGMEKAKFSHFKTQTLKILATLIALYNINTDYSSYYNYLVFQYVIIWILVRIWVNSTKRIELYYSEAKAEIELIEDHLTLHKEAVKDEEEVTEEGTFILDNFKLEQLEQRLLSHTYLKKEM